MAQSCCLKRTQIFLFVSASYQPNELHRRIIYGCASGWRRATRGPARGRRRREICSDRGMTVRFLSLNDPQGLHTVRVGQLEFSILGYAGSKFQFLRAAVRAASRNPDLVIALHPHFAPIVSAMHLCNQKFRSIVFTHGIEVWEPLAWPRGGALRSADLVIGPSTDTVQHLINEQQIPPTKVQRLAWGLDPEFEARMASGIPTTPPAGFPLEVRNILTVGRWNSAEKYKGADTLISALPRILKTTPDASLVLVGDGDDRPDLSNSLATLTFQNTHIFFTA